MFWDKITTGHKSFMIIANSMTIRRCMKATSNYPLIQQRLHNVPTAFVCSRQVQRRVAEITAPPPRSLEQLPSSRAPGHIFFFKGYSSNSKKRKSIIFEEKISFSKNILRNFYFLRKRVCGLKGHHSTLKSKYSHPTYGQESEVGWVYSDPGDSWQKKLPRNSLG